MINPYGISENNKSTGPTLEESNKSLLRQGKRLEAIRKYYSTTHVCKNCNQEISNVDGYWFHKRHRWNEDNGYYCFENDYMKTGSPIDTIAYND